LGVFVIVPEIGLEGFFFDLRQAGVLLFYVKDDLGGFELFVPRG
jgi:hypothetical protein